MILASTPCTPQLLPKLLNGELSAIDNQRLEDHVGRCSKCQRQLEEIAGNAHWWNSTETALRQLRSGISTDEGTKDFEQSAHEETSVRAGSSTQTPRLHDQGPHDGQLSDAGWLLRIAPNGMLGPFRLERTIGHGGTGVVAQAVDTQLNRRVAVKVLYPHLASSGSARQRFAREAQAAAAVVHPSVVPIHAVDAEHDPPYLVMSYVPGGSLQQRLDKQGPLELVELLRIALQIADGLSAAHSQGLVHRDVKPANILLEAGTDRVLLTDFGLARALDDATLTASGFVAGTPPYMSPEQAKGESIDCRSDLFSVGSLMFAMATGRPPYQGASALHILQRVTDQRTPLVREINERMPAWLDRLIGLCHTKSANDRIASAEVLAELIRQCLAHVQKPNVFALPKELAQQKASRPMLVGAGLLAGSLLGLLGGWYFGPTMSTVYKQNAGASSKLQQEDPKTTTNEDVPRHLEAIIHPSTPFANDLSIRKPTIVQQEIQLQRQQTLDLQELPFDLESSRLHHRIQEIQLQLEGDWK